MRTPKILIPLSLLLLAQLSIQAADAKSEFTCSLSSGEPQITKDVAFTSPSKTGGMSVFWIQGQGGRTLGQQFRVESAFEARQLAVQINSGTDGFDAKAPFKLSFAKADGSPQPGATLAEFTGIVTSKEIPSSGKWLSFSFPAVSFAPGQYVFLLQYTEPGTKGRSLVLNVSTNTGDYSGGKGVMSDSKDPTKLNFGPPLCFILSSSPADSQEHVTYEPRILQVDQRGGADYTSLQAAAKDCRPGDTISIAAGSGPYREVLDITQSGRPDAPIVIEGNGELITGFEPLSNFHKSGDTYVCEIPVAFPYVLTYQGKRLRQDAETGQFGKYALLSEDKKSIQLLPGVSTEGWEVSTRTYVVKIWNVSHHVYRNLRACGAQNDAFNLHGVGENLVFENIEGFHSLDEGFSAHDDISCEIRSGKFYGNDNGIVNIASSFMKASDVTIEDNLGWGLHLLRCSADLNNIVVKDNGLAQIILADSEVNWTHVTAVTPTWNARPWTTYKESAGKDAIKNPLVVDSRTKMEGSLPTLL